MRVLLTGGAGFLGSRLLKKLKHFGHKVTSIDLVAHEGGEVGDILDIRLWERLKNETYDYVIHAAAKTNTKESKDQEREYFITNKRGTELVANYCIDSGAKLIFLSSDSVTDGDSPFAYSKKEAETLLISLQTQFTELLILRLFNVYELGAGRNDLFTVLEKAKKEGLEVELHSGGVQLKDFVHTHDVTNLILSLVQRAKEAFAIRKPRIVYDVGTGNATSIKDVADAFDVKWRKVLPKEGDPYVSVADISAAKDDFNFHPEVNVIEEIKGTSKPRILPPPVVVEEIKRDKPKVVTANVSVSPLTPEVAKKVRGPYKKKKKRGPKPKDKKGKTK